MSRKPRGEKGASHAPMREVMAGLFNLEMLLGSPRAGSQLVLDVLPELSRGMGALASAFDDAPSALRDFAIARVESLRQAIDGVSQHIAPRVRLSLLHVLSHARPEIEAAVDLLLLFEQAQAPEPVELDLAEVLRVAFEGPPPSSHLRVENARGSLVYDARILTTALRHAIARVLVDDAAKEADVRVVASSSSDAAQIDFTREKPAHSNVTKIPVKAGTKAVAAWPKLPRVIAPTPSVVDAVLAEHASALATTERGATLSLRAMTAPP